MTLLKEKSNSVSSRAKPRDLALNILQTLKYSDHFGFPLTLEEIYLRLVEERSSRALIVQTINRMIASKLIEKTGNYYHLPKRKSLVARRLSKAKISTPQLKRAKEISGQLSKTPFVLAIYLTGSLAMSNSNPNADIDLMVITKNHRLWTTRILLTIYTELLRLRRRPLDPNPSGKVCLNLYLTPDSFALPVPKQSLYTAYELIQAVPLYDPHDTHSDIFSANPWIHNFLPNVAKRPLLKRNSRVQLEKGPVATGRSVLMGTIELFLYHLQLLYMRPKLTREYITPDSAFFHPNDPGVNALRGLSLKGIPGSKPRRDHQPLEGESSM